MKDADNLLANNQADAAVKLLTSMLERHPNDVPVMVNLGVAYTHAGRPDKAKELLLAATELEKNYVVAYINLAAAEISLGQLLDAMTHINVAIAHAPDLGRAHITKAQIFTDMDRHEDAYRTLLHAQTLDTTDAQIQIKLGNSAWKQRMDEAALNHFRQAVALDPANIKAHLNIAKLCISMQRLEEANEAYRAARDIDPNDPFVRDFEAWWTKLKQQSTGR
jgi:tetratricopeptide (TPR) repeat protein